ncbi:MAG: 1-deoxy-D-xylulose-5-phosphate synthase [Pirellulaceae bacterium]|jgi:1-deoxy-D-xylulose-5-phosphate synthase|nr:1-deoxy-D-xylulose-5-phosphate synthase [Pirellulaceae bacterium]MDP7019671.1 1-deoxy-D-xylulose-5-phosphate synthase [Pirellulaceae bacterium]
MHKLLSQLDSAEPLRDMSLAELEQLGDEIRDVLCNLLSERTAHFASNLGVVELCLALHSSFDFRRDRLLWDTGHQVYPHKLVTGRYHEFGTIRTKGGLMGYPNPEESEYDLFMTGHAGCSVSTVLGIRAGDQLLSPDRYSVAVIGDGAFPSGIVYEALNNISEVKDKLLIVLNDNKMSICPRVGGMASYLDRLRTNSFYTGLKTEVVKVLNKVPLLGDPAERFLAQIKEGVKAGLHGGMLFEDLGLRYIGPIDGHDIGLIRKYLAMVRDLEGPILLHVVTEKGHGFEPAAEDPVFFHTPPAFVNDNGHAVPKSKGGSKAYTNFARDAIHQAAGKDEHVTVMTAAMCQGNKLEPVREDYPEQFFDTGICESHAVAFAAGQAKAGLRPVVAIYSTFLQRSFDQIFQEVALQNQPVTFMLDRAGLAGPDGPTHHGVYDLAYMRVFPNMTVMAPGDARDVGAMLDFALSLDGPSSLRYPKAAAETIDGPRADVELGRCEVLREGADGTLVGCGVMVHECLRAADLLKDEGLELGVINARFVKPIDRETFSRVLALSPFVVTVEEGCLMGGFGAALLEMACDQGLDTSRLTRLGVADEFIEHGDRGELLAELGLDAAGIAATCRRRANPVSQDIRDSAVG